MTRHLLSDEPVPPFEPRPSTIVKPLSDSEEVWRALVLGLRDFIDKNGMPSVVLGLSGGIDSALVAALAVDALGADRVYGVGLPSKWSSEHSLSDAEDSATRLGLHYSVVPIAPMVEAYEKSVELSGVAAENLQARVRGTLLMGLSNQHGHLLLATSNKSEVAVGYSTLYGDAAGGFAPIKDVPKTLVWELARWRNAEARAPRRDRADPAELDRQAAVGRARARTAGQRLAALLRGARRRHRRLRRPRPRHGPAARARARRRGGRQGPPVGGHGRVQAPAVGPGNEDQPEGVRPGSAAADHQPVAGVAAHRPRRSGTSMSESVLYGGTSSARVRVHHLQQAKERGEKWAMLTAYDTYSAAIFEEAGIPVMLVGDSSGNVVLGYSSTVPVTVDDLLLMTKAVTRSTKRSLIVADLPFGVVRVRPRSRPSTPPSGS